MVDIAELHVTRTAVLPVAPDRAYAMVADVTRMGEWSPVRKVCAWEGGGGPAVGAWFTGKNVAGEREWETRCEVVVAEPGEEFAWVVGGAEEGTTRWGYRFRPADGGGTEVEESWGFVRLHERMEQMTDEQIESMKARTTSSIEGTLANLVEAATAGP